MNLVSIVVVCGLYITSSVRFLMNLNRIEGVRGVSYITYSVRFSMNLVPIWVVRGLYIN